MISLMVPQTDEDAVYTKGLSQRSASVISGKKSDTEKRDVRSSRGERPKRSQNTSLHRETVPCASTIQRSASASLSAITLHPGYGTVNERVYCPGSAYRIVPGEVSTERKQGCRDDLQWQETSCTGEYENPWGVGLRINFTL